MKNQGILITFEGIDGSGKSTQALLLYKKLRSSGYDVLLTREPGGTDFAENIRKITLDTNININNTTLTFLFLAARNDHVVNVIKPALDSGKIVISDRFYDSTFVYQGMSNDDNNVVHSDLALMNSIATTGIIPNLTILLDANPNTLFKRRMSRGIMDRYEEKDLEFQLKIRESFLKISELYSDRIVVVNSDTYIDFIAEKIFKIVKEKIQIEF